MLTSRNLTGKQVVIVASGMTYEGKLIEMNDVSVILKSAQGFSEIPLERISEMKEKTGEVESFLSPSPLRNFFTAKATENKD